MIRQYFINLRREIGVIHPRKEGLDGKPYLSGVTFPLLVSALLKSVGRFIGIHVVDLKRAVVSLGCSSTGFPHIETL